MKIEKITINSFGNIKDQSYDFADGINIIEGPNEAGKSTMGAFIKFIFFGLSAKTDGISVSERKKYQSWEDDCASGSLEFVSGGKKYLIERSIIASNSGAGRESVKIIDLESSEEILHDTEPGKYFFGVDGDLFSQTAYIRQTDGADGINGRSVSESIENMLFSGNERIDSEKARADIENGMTALLYKNKKGGMIYELGNEMERVRRKFEESREQNHRLVEIENRINAVQTEKARISVEAGKNSDILKAREAQRTLEKFALLDSAESEYEEKKKELEDYKESVRANGFIPDDNYLDNIVTIESEVSSCRDRLSAAQENLRALGGDKVDAEDLELLEKAGKEGGEEGIKNFFENCRRSARLSRTLGIFFAVFAVLWGALAAVCVFLPAVSSLDLFGFSMKKIGFIVAGLAFLMIVLAIVFFVRSSGIAKKADKKTVDYGVTAENDIYVELRVAASRLSNQKTYLADLEKAKNECADIQREKETQENNLSLAASHWGRTLVAAYTSEDLIRETRNTVLTIGTKTAALETAAGKYDTAKALTGNLDREGAKRDTALADLSSLTDEDEQNAKEKLELLSAEDKETDKETSRLETERAALSATVRDSAALLDELSDLSGRAELLKNKYNSLELASKTLDEAAKNLRNNVSPRLSMQASELMRKATEDKYSSISISSDMAVQYGTSDGGVSYNSHEADYMSKGTRDLVYISLRLALIGFMYKKELPPLVFDEAFAMLDRKRLEGISKIVADYVSKSGQAFIFTCQGREAEIFGAQANVNHILL